MCGITGIFNWKTGKKVERGLLRAMNEKIVHRGPDWCDTWAEGEFGFGMVRLAIIGKDEANQPLWTDNGNLGIVFNGEIYNYKEINRSLGIRTTADSRTFLELFSREGTEAFGRLAGFFAGAIFDRKKRGLTLFRDRFGKKPLFVVETSDGAAFASEIKPLLLLDNFRKEIDMRSIAAFLNFSYMPPGMSPVKGIVTFPAASWRSYETFSSREGRYWDLSHREPEPNAEEEFDERFAVAVRRRLVSDVPIGIFLSGGMDSNAVLAMALREKKNSVVKAYTIAPTEGESEVHIARHSCKHFGIPLEEIELGPADITKSINRVARTADNLLANPPMFALDALSQRASGQLKVILSGGGGDEIFFGYSTWKADWAFKSWRLVPGFIQGIFRDIAGRLPVDYSPHAFSYGLEKVVSCPTRDVKKAHAWWRTVIVGRDLGLLNPDFRDTWDEVYGEAYSFAARRFPGFVRQTALADLLVWWQGMGLYQFDNIPMGWGVELRNPFMDYELVEWTMRLPLSKLYHPLKSKLFLRQKLSRFLPERIVKGRKRPFYIPLGQWLAGPLSDFLQDILYGSEIIRQGILQAEGVEKLVSEHLNKQKDNSFKLLSLMMLTRWYEEVFLQPAYREKPVETGYERTLSQGKVS